MTVKVTSLASIVWKITSSKMAATTSKVDDNKKASYHNLDIFQSAKERKPVSFAADDCMGCTGKIMDYNGIQSKWPIVVVNLLN